MHCGIMRLMQRLSHLTFLFYSFLFYFQLHRTIAKRVQRQDCLEIYKQLAQASSASKHEPQQQQSAHPRMLRVVSR